MRKVILITGASSGIGFATLEQLVSEGHLVYGTGRKDIDLKKIDAAGARPLKVEMIDYSSIEKAIKNVITEQKRIDVLVNNAGYGLYGAVEDVPIDAAKHQFEVNLFGLARITQLVTPIMRKQKSGTIINISSMGGKIYTPLGAWYHASKHALEGWSDCLRFELKPFGVNVVIIEPGAISTPWGNTMYDSMAKYSAKFAYRTLVKSMQKATENSYKKQNGSKPAVVANTISKALASDNPKARYAVGKYAKSSLLARRILTDTWFDRVVRHTMGR